MNNVKRNQIVDAIVVFVLLLICSMVTYFAMNAFWADIANAAVGFNFPYCFATVPIFTIALFLITFFIFFVRYLTYPKEEKMLLVMHYAKLFIIYSAIGLIFTIICATPLVYGSCLTPCPFPGSLIVYFVVHALIIAANILLLVKMKGALNENDKKHKNNWKSVLYTIFISLFVFIAFDRCGAAIISPTYIEWSKLYLTWFFFLSLLMPMFVLITLILFKLNHLDLKNYLVRTIIWSVFSVVCIALTIATVITGTNNSIMVSLISPAMPIERLATIPIDFIVLYIPVDVLALAELIKAIILLIKNKKAPVEQPAE